MSAEPVPSYEQDYSAGECWFLSCASTDTRRYITGPACDQHAPWALAGHKDPATQVDHSRTDRATRKTPTPLWAKGGTDINKERPGGYMSRQRAQKVAEQRDAASTLQHPERQP